MKTPVKTLLTLAFLALTATATATAQTALKQTYVCDRTGDDIWSLVDRNCDLDYNDPGEAVRFFDSAVGGLLLNNCSAIVQGPGGALFVSALTSDVIARLQDLNGDGTAHGAGEAVVVFDNSNLSGVSLWSANNLTFGPNGDLFLAHANAGGGGIDAIYRLSDGNMDGDYNDAGEATPYYVPANVSSVGDSLPADLHWGLDGALYYLDVGSTGAVAKGIYRLVDANNDNVIDPATEVSAFFLPTVPAGGSNQFFWGFDQAADGTFYMADTLNERVYAFRDADGNNSIGTGESSVIWTAPGSSNIWHLDVDNTGKIYCTEDQSPDRLLALRDDDGNGTITAAETRTVYDDTVSPMVISSPRSVVAVDLPAFYAGNSTDLATTVDVDSLPSESTSNIHCVDSSDLLTFHFVSLGGNMNGAPLLAVIQPFVTGSPAAPLQLDPLDAGPSVYLDLAAPIGILVDGFAPTPANPLIAVVGGWSFTAVLPAALGGQNVSLMIETFALVPGHNGVGIANAPSTEVRIL